MLRPYLVEIEPLLALLVLHSNPFLGSLKELAELSQGTEFEVGTNVNKNGHLKNKCKIKVHVTSFFSTAFGCVCGGKGSLGNGKASVHR